MIYVQSVLIAFIIFCVCLYFSFIPYMVYQYNKNGEIHKKETFIKYSFLLYLITAYLLIMYPLPSIEYVSKLTGPKYNLIPFRFIIDFFKDSGFKLTKFSTYLSALKDPSFFTVLFNLFLFLPLGVYAKKYLKFNIQKTFCLAFLMSLFFELTQLSGLYFIYPRPYRLFDVDDLMINTLGAICGYVLAVKMDKFLPEIEKNESNPNKELGFFRRIISFYVDLFIVKIFIYLSFNLIDQLIAVKKYEIIYANVIYIIYFIFIYYAMGATSIGKHVVGIKTVDRNNKMPNFIQIIIRNGILLFGVHFGFNILRMIDIDKGMMQLIIFFAIVISLICFYVNIILKGIKKEPFFYENIAETKDIISK